MHPAIRSRVALSQASWRSRLLTTLPRGLQVHQQRNWTRGFADHVSHVSDKPLKPKASTPLRRAAAASLPIRANPTPTRSPIQPVFTLSTAERYVLPKLRKYLPPSAQVLQEAWWVPKWGANGKQGEVFVFGNGSIVCWGLGEEEAAKFARDVLRKAKAEVGALQEPETEDLEFVTDPSE